MIGAAGQIGELSLPEELSRPLMRESREAAPEEACGLLLGRREGSRVRVARTVACKNIAPAGMRDRRFEIDPRRLLEEERSARGSDEEVIGFYHSHPDSDPVPSAVDLSFMALWPDKVWVIVRATGASSEAAVRAWRLDGEDAAGPREIPITGGSIEDAKGF